MRAPIALFVYNRPDHTRRTLAALAANRLASDSDLFIFADAAKTTDALDAVSDVRRLIRNVDGFKNVHVIEQAQNRGLAKSIIGGTTRLCNEFGRAIVVEDDLITSPFFLTFMNDALDRYSDSEDVLHVSGSTYPIRSETLPQTYFLRLPLCWGWGTWKRAWNRFEKSISVMERFDRRMIDRFNFDNTFQNFWGQLEANGAGTIDTWFIFWYATVFLHRGLVLFPKHSMVQNIGMDGSGVHGSCADDFNADLSTGPVEVDVIDFEESELAFELHKAYFRGVGPPAQRSTWRKLAHLLGRRAA